MRRDTATEATIVAKYAAISDLLDERSRRLWAAAEMWETTGKKKYLIDFENRARTFATKIDFDFDWGDIEVPEDVGEASFFFNTQIWSFGYMYSFINKPDAELSFFANVFILGVNTGLDVENRDIHDRFGITAPLPSFGYRFSYEILPKVRFGGTHSLFFLQIGDYGGTINNVKLNLDYRALKWLSAGISYSKFNLDINAQKKNFKGNIKYAYEGPGLYLQVLF